MEDLKLPVTLNETQEKIEISSENYNKVDWSDNFIHTAKIEEVQTPDSKEFEKFKKDLDDIYKFLGGNNRKTLTSNSIGDYVDNFNSSLLKVQIGNEAVVSQTRKGWYSSSEIIDKVAGLFKKKDTPKDIEQLQKEATKAAQKYFDEQTEVSTEESEPLKQIDVAPVRSNFSLGHLLRKMPLFSQNMFSVYFIYNDEAVEPVNLTSYNKTYSNIINGFGVRLIDFQIPQPKNQTYSIKVLDREIKKVASSFEMAHKVELTFEVDQMGLLLQHFQILSNGNAGTNANDDFIIQADNVNYKVETFPAAFRNRNKLKMVVLFNDMRDYNDKSKLIDGLLFDEKVKALYQGKEAFYKNAMGQIIGDTSSYREFIFDDVQFLGITKTLDFDRDNTSEMKISAAFRFREVLETDNNIIRSNSPQ